MHVNTRKSPIIQLLAALVAAIIFMLPQIVMAKSHAEPAEDKTLSPYFFVKSDDPDVDKLPLKSTGADVKIAGVIADVTITQEYKNEGKNTLEAIYVFPGSTRAAIYAMKMTVGDRVIEADIMKRKEARETYEKAKQEGKTAALLEQQRPNVFQMNVANILPGDLIKVELKYTELITPEENVYEFVYPAVVGPRYSNMPVSKAADTEKWVENPYLRSGKGAPYDFHLNVGLQSGIPVERITSPSHKVDVEYTGRKGAYVKIKDDPKAGTKDFVLRYKLAGGKIETGLLLYPGEKENFFLMMMAPPARVAPDKIVPREYIFIVDVSGSMNGFPLTEVAKPLMAEMINNLKSNEFMNVLLFAGGSAVLSEGHSLPATESNKKKAISWINSRQAGGGTEILPALKRALALPAKEGVSRTIVIVTDGYVHVEPQVFDLIRKNLGQANLFAFGIGSSVNRHLIEGMARAGLGEPFVVLNAAEGKKKAEKFRQYIESPVLTDIKVDFNGFDVYDVEPESSPDLFALRPILVFGKYKGKASGKIYVTGKTSSGEFSGMIRTSSANPSLENSGLRYLWARHKIRRIADMNMIVNNPAREKEITELGLKYTLMTAYTSFVAVDKIRRADGKLVTVKQPLPLPDGVSDMAVADRSAPRKMMAPSAGSMAPLAKPTVPSPEPETEAKAKGNGDGLDKKVVINVDGIVGEMPRWAVEKALKDNRKLFEKCYASATGGRAEDIKGKSAFSITIGQDGKVKKVILGPKAIKDFPTLACLQLALKSITFPAPGKGEVKVMVSISFN